MDVNHLLEAMIKMKASDLHLKVGSPPVFRINGILHPVNHNALTPKDTQDAMETITPARKRQSFDTKGSADFSYSIPKVARYRMNIFHQRGSISLAARLVSFNIPTFEELNLPPVLSKIADNRTGLILVTGVTGSGKSSTLAAIIHHINRTRSEHIITIEDPIEFLHRDNKSIVNQMELAIDIDSYETALKHILRQDPNVILIGEMRDRQTAKTALTAAETGHLVLSTLHTPDAGQTINRIIHFFGTEDERLILEQLSMNLRAVISQRLLRNSDGSGRIPACEVMINTPIISKCIREGHITEIKQAIQNMEDGMQTFNESLVQLTRAKKITFEEGLKYCDDDAKFRRNVTGRYSDGDRAGLVGNF
jgi:twitching motility protein PilT